MVYAIFTFIALGIAGGYFFLGLEHKDLLDEILMSALYFMVFVAGIEIGGNRHIIKKICNPQSILLAVAIPTAVTIGSLGGAALSAFVTGMEMRDALLVGSALGWYSLSSVVISTLYSVEIGTIAFLANMLREVLAFLAIPLLVKINKFLALAPSGAATMDSGLPGYQIYQYPCRAIRLYQRPAADAAGTGAAFSTDAWSVKKKSRACLKQARDYCF